MKILITADKFRGSLEANQVIQAVKNGLVSVDSHLEIQTSILADGGEGSMELLSKAYDCQRHQIQVKNANHDWIESNLGFNPKTKIAVLEMASYVGLAQLSENQQDPKSTSSFGLGQAIKEAVTLGAQKIIIGIGGSATNDGGAGMLAALDFQFLAKDEKSISPNGGNLNLISKILPPVKNVCENIELILASDVQNPITGKSGATMTYASQKGASEEELDILEKNMIQYAHLIERTTSKKSFEIDGYGAAGGVPLSACSFLNAKLVSGSQLIFDSLDLGEKIKEADVVITGEGKIDNQTMFGKAITPVIEMSQVLNKKLVLVCGLFDAKSNPTLSKIPRFELTSLAEKLNKNSYKDAFELCELVGGRIIHSLRSKQAFLLISILGNLL